MSRPLLSLGVGLSAFFLILPAAHAQDIDEEDEATSSSESWEFGAGIYGWLPDISGRTRFSEGPGGGEIDVPISDILDNLEFTFQAAFVARKGRWGMYADLIYLDVSASEPFEDLESIGGSELPGPVSGTATLDMTSWIVTAAGTWRAGDDGEGRRTLDLLAGVRYADISQTLDVAIDGPPGDLPPDGPEFPLKVSGDVTDFVVGMRGRIAWTEDGSWFTPYYADIGTGDSDVTWQAMIGAGYTFGWGDVVLAYRHMDYSLPSGRAIETLEFSGPAIGAIFHF